MDKIEKLLHMTAYPGQYSDQQMEALLDDSEMRSLYELMVTARSGFEQRRNKTVKTAMLNPTKTATAQTATLRTDKPLWRRVAAAVAALLTITTFAVAAYWMVTRNQQPTAPVATQTPAVIEQTAPTTVTQQPTATASEVLFEDVELQTILMKMGKYYNKKVVFKNDSTRHIRLYIKWNQKENVKETIERLNNFEKVNIKLDGDNIVSE